MSLGEYENFSGCDTETFFIIPHFLCLESSVINLG